MMSLVLGWFGRGLLRPPLLMLISLLEALFLSGAQFWDVVVLRFRVVRLGERKVRKSRSNAADVHEAGDVFMYRDSSIQPLLDLGRGIKAVMDVLDSMVRSDVSLARVVELAVQWDKVLRTGPVHLVTLDNLQSVRGGNIGSVRRVTGDLHCRLTDFVHKVVVHRRDEAIRGWRNWLLEDPFAHTYEWLRPDIVHPAPFLQCKPHLTPGGSGVLADPAGIDEEFRKTWLPYICRSGQREVSLEELVEEVDGWLPLLPELSLPELTGEIDAC